MWCWWKLTLLCASHITRQLFMQFVRDMYQNLKITPDNSVHLLWWCTSFVTNLVILVRLLLYRLCNIENGCVMFNKNTSTYCKTQHGNITQDTTGKFLEFRERGSSAFQQWFQIEDRTIIKQVTPGFVQQRRNIRCNDFPVHFRPHHP